MFSGSAASRSIAAASLGATLGVAVVILLTIVFFQWAGGITPYDIVTLDQQSRLELEGLVIAYMQVVTVVIGVPLGCWFILRRTQAPGAGATALFTIPWSWLLWVVALRQIPSGPNDALVLPYAFFGAVVLAAALARGAILLIQRAAR